MTPPLVATTAIVPIGVAAPVTFAVAIAAGGSGIDLTTAVAVSLNVQRADLTTTSWSATIQSVTPPSAPGGSLLIATYMFASNGLDCPVIGQYQVQPIITIPGGSFPAYAQILYVTSPFNTL